MPDISNTSTPLTDDGEYTMTVVPGNSYRVSLEFDNGNGDVTVKDSDGNAFDKDGVPVVISETGTATSFIVVPRGRSITLSLANGGGSPSISHLVENLGRVL